MGETFIPRRRVSTPRLCASLLLLATLSLISAGCASMHAQGSNTLGDPAQGGLAVVEVALEADFSSDPVMESTLADLQIGRPGLLKVTEGVVERLDSRAPARVGRPLSGLLFFAGLEPGTYALRSLGHPRILVDHTPGLDIYCERQEFNLRGGREENLRFEIGANDLVYLGKITVRADYHADADPDRQIVEFRGGDAGIRLERTAANEIKVLNTLLARAPHSPWAPEIRRRIESLEAER